MMVELIHEPGKRQNNEDYLLSDLAERIFMVCDGVGGHEKGEEASKLAILSFSEFLKGVPEINDISLKSALKYTENAFDLFVEKNENSRGMATTLTFLYFSDDNHALVAHCGDSKVYQLRDGQIIFKTKDHSLVQELVDGGFISEDEAVNHPKKNQITRAIQGSKYPTKLDIKHLEDIRSGDYFMLCSDGIMEGIDEKSFADIFKSDSSLKSTKTFIYQQCMNLSKDNFTAILIKKS